MNKKIISLLSLVSVFALVGCAKTNPRYLYGENAYNSPIFDENYYTDWDGIKELLLEGQSNGAYSKLFFSDDSVVIGGIKQEGYTWGGLKEEQFGYNNNLAKIEKKFSYGITSKLFDGRVRCERLYQKSRVQLDKSGFAMFFPKSLVGVKYLGLACRGGTDYSAGQEFSHDDLLVNFSWSFYIHLENGKYNKVTYKLSNVKIPVDNSGNTAFISFVPYLGDNFDELYGAVAMSLEWHCVDDRMPADLTDDYTQKEKHHLSLMLYEVFIGDSTWY